jgi:hypothetical protein
MSTIERVTRTRSDVTTRQVGPRAARSLDGGLRTRAQLAVEADERWCGTVGAEMRDKLQSCLEDYRNRGWSAKQHAMVKNILQSNVEWCQSHDIPLRPIPPIVPVRTIPVAPLPQAPDNPDAEPPIPSTPPTPPAQPAQAGGHVFVRAARLLLGRSALAEMHEMTNHEFEARVETLPGWPATVNAREVGKKFYPLWRLSDLEDFVQSPWGEAYWRLFDDPVIRETAELKQQMAALQARLDALGQ